MLLEAVHLSSKETYQKSGVGADPLSNPCVTKYLQGSFGCREGKGFFPPTVGHLPFNIGKKKTSSERSEMPHYFLTVLDVIGAHYNHFLQFISPLCTL